LLDLTAPVTPIKKKNARAFFLRLEIKEGKKKEAQISLSPKKKGLEGEIFAPA